MLEQDRSGPDFLIFGEKLGLSNLSATRMTVSLLGRLTQAVNATSRMPSRCCFPIIVATVPRPPQSAASFISDARTSTLALNRRGWPNLAASGYPSISDAARSAPWWRCSPASNAIGGICYWMPLPEVPRHWRD